MIREDKNGEQECPCNKPQLNRRGHGPQHVVSNRPFHLQIYQNRVAGKPKRGSDKLGKNNDR